MPEHPSTQLIQTLDRSKEHMDSLRRVAASLTAPWLHAAAALLSVTGFCELQGIGRLLCGTQAHSVPALPAACASCSATGAPRFFQSSDALRLLSGSRTGACPDRISRQGL